MKRRFFLFLSLLPFIFIRSQVVITTPAFPIETDSVTITYDASKGSAGLINCACDVYIHIGLITNLSTSNTDWKHVFTTWGQVNNAWKMTSLGNNSYTYKLAPSLRSAFNVLAGETIQKLAMVFRNGDGSKTGKDNGGNDIFAPIYPANIFAVSFNSPAKGSIINLNDSVHVLATTSKRAALTLFENGVQVASLPNDSILAFNTLASSVGNVKMVIAATYNGNTTYDTLRYVVYGTTPIASLPMGVTPGITYLNASSVTLCLIAPYKNYIYVVGDFTDWYPNASTLMNKTPDGKYFWITLTGLQSSIEYAYQYLIDGALKVADPMCDKVLDPWNDKYIPSSIYPNLKQYPTGKTNGIVSVFQIGQSAFNWQYSANFTKPNRDNLNVYELLIRDFHQNHNFKTIMDSLEYLKRMGINALELMPFNEFEGNESWGYNPDFYFAVDKAYGHKNELKQLIDKCHQNGIAVIMDMVLNHSFGQSPMVQMYFNSTTGQVTAQSPWFNIAATHPFSVGYDFNHESGYTKDFVDTVLSYWIQEFKLDGFRFDLSKGFTQKNSGGDVGLWGQFDQSRIDLWQRIDDKVKTYSPSAYMILEHLGDNSEEKELANRGFMLWGIMNNEYNQNTMGYSSNSNLSWGSAKARSFNNNNLVLYMESHDEERLMYKNLQYGNSSGSYFVKDFNTALKRNEAAAALFYSQPGPKMIWQFGELGYDYSINRCGNGTINSTCRTDAKPIKWDYLLDPNRYHLYQVFGAMQLLHANPEFRTSNYEWNTSTMVKNAKVTGTNLKVTTLCNFDVVAQSGTPNFQQTGWWYDYFSGDSIYVNNMAISYLFQPGEYHVYTTPRVALPSWITAKPAGNGMTPQISNTNNRMKLYPNPAQHLITLMVTDGGISTLHIKDITGKVLCQKANDFSVNNTYHFPYLNLASGLYFVELESAGNHWIEKLIIE